MRCLILYAYPPESDGQSIQGELLRRGILNYKHEAIPCHFKDSMQKQFYLKHVKPDFHVKGEDWEGKRIPEMDVLEEYGGEMRYIKFVPGHSTTNIIKKILKAYIDKIVETHDIEQNL